MTIEESLIKVLKKSFENKNKYYIEENSMFETKNQTKELLEKVLIECKVNYINNSFNFNNINFHKKISRFFDSDIEENDNNRLGLRFWRTDINLGIILDIECDLIQTDEEEATKLLTDKFIEVAGSLEDLKNFISFYRLSDKLYTYNYYMENGILKYETASYFVYETEKRLLGFFGLNDFHYNYLSTYEKLENEKDLDNKEIIPIFIEKYENFLKKVQK